MPTISQSSGEVFVVVPAYNEGAVLGRTVDGLLSSGFTVVVVDDGSTIPAITFLHDPSVHCVRHASNLGQGAALQTGMEYALTRGARIIVHFDE